MINTLGSLSLVWLILWFTLTLVFRVVYPLVRPVVLKLHPGHGSSLLLLYWAAPVLLALSASVMLYAPVFEGLLISPHCHGSCDQHAPQIGALSLAWLGLLAALLVAGGLLISFAWNLWHGSRMQRQFEALASHYDNYYLLDSDEPVVFTLGWWRPEVFISKGLSSQCSTQQLSVILDHEQAHLQRRDNLRLLLVRVFSLVLPFRSRQLVMHDLQILCEQACDFASAEKHGAVPVAETLVHVGRLIKNAVRPRSSLAFDGGDLALRVQALLSKEHRHIMQAWQLSLICLVTGLGLLMALDPLHHGAEWLIGWLDASGMHTHW